MLPLLHQDLHHRTHQDDAISVEKPESVSCEGRNTPNESKAQTSKHTVIIAYAEKTNKQEVSLPRCNHILQLSEYVAFQLPGKQNPVWYSSPFWHPPFSVWEHGMSQRTHHTFQQILGSQPRLLFQSQASFFPAKYEEASKSNEVVTKEGFNLLLTMSSLSVRVQHVSSETVTKYGAQG